MGVLLKGRERRERGSGRCLSFFPFDLNEYLKLCDAKFSFSDTYVTSVRSTALEKHGGNVATRFNFIACRPSTVGCVHHGFANKKFRILAARSRSGTSPSLEPIDCAGVKKGFSANEYGFTLDLGLLGG